MASPAELFHLDSKVALVTGGYGRIGESRRHFRGSRVKTAVAAASAAFLEWHQTATQDRISPHDPGEPNDLCRVKGRNATWNPERGSGLIRQLLRVTAAITPKQ